MQAITPRSFSRAWATWNGNKVRVYLHEQAAITVVASDEHMNLFYADTKFCCANSYKEMCPWNPDNWKVLWFSPSGQSARHFPQTHDGAPSVPGSPSLPRSPWSWLGWRERKHVGQPMSTLRILTWKNLMQFGSWSSFFVRDGLFFVEYNVKISSLKSKKLFNMKAMWAESPNMLKD